MASFESKVARVIDKFNERNLSPLENQNENVVGYHGSLGHCGRILGSCIF